MKTSLTNWLKRSPTWIVLGIALLAAAGVLLIAAFFDFGAAAPTPEPTAMVSFIATATATTADAETESAVATPAETPTVERNPEPGAIAATVNGYTITQVYLGKTVALNEVLGELSGADTLGKRETLERMIRSQLILQGANDVEAASEEDVKGFIAALQENWGVSQLTVDAKLSEAGLDRAFLEETIGRLLTVQTGAESLQAEGHNVSTWLREQAESSEIMIYEDLTEAEDEEAEPTPEAEAALPDVAPGFRLDQAGGGTFTLADQLEEGPVVLVFFEKCG